MIALTQQLRQVAGHAEDLGTLGSQIRFVLDAFAKPEALHKCHVLLDQVRGNQALCGEGKRRYLDPERLPSTADVKAIAIDASSLFVELAPLDYQSLDDSKLPKGVRLDVKKHEMWHGRRKLAHIAYSSHEVRLEHGERWLWMIPWPKLSKESLDLAIKTLDLFFEEGLLSGENGSESQTVSGMAPPRDMSQRLELQLDVIQQQIPVLAMRMEMRPALNQSLRMGQSLELQQLQRFERWLSRNPVEAIQDALERDDSPAGQARLVKFIEFKLARDVREAAKSNGREIAWPEARRIVRKMMRG